MSNIINTTFRLLTFRITSEEILSFNNKHLALGIAGTWFVGIGHYWDHENANPFQYAGLGSVIYFFILSAFIWFIVLPYKPTNWKYKTVLTFISLTSFPAILYAIPVEIFMNIENAASTNAWFLLIVAAWRVIVLFIFLNKYKELLGYVTTITFLPLVIIVSSLSLLNLEKVVFNIMGGIRHTNAAYKAFDVLLFMTFISVILLLPFLAAYVYGIFDKKRVKK